MDNIYALVRSIFFVWAFLLFMAMVYVGIQDMFLARKCGHTSRSKDHEWFALAALMSCLSLVVALEWTLHNNIPGGWRVLLPALWLVPVTAGLVRGFSRVRDHRQAVKNGNCPDGVIE